MSIYGADKYAVMCPKDQFSCCIVFSGPTLREEKLGCKALRWISYAWFRSLSTRVLCIMSASNCSS